MKIFFSFCRSALVLALLVVSIVPDVHASAMPTSTTRQPATTPLETLLNADGTLNLSTGFSGSLDLSGWHMALAADGTPHFSRMHSGDSASNVPVLKPASLPDDAYWDGRFDYPPGVSGSAVNALAVSGDDLYVGGIFTTTGSLRANYIARWSPKNGWSALGNGLNNPVDALVVTGSMVYAGGYFTQICGNATCNIGNTSANHVAMWNGRSWSALGNGLDDAVNALAVSGSTVYAGGGFTQVCGNLACNSGNTTARSTAMWNGSSWSALGNGINGSVDALAVSGSTVYAGGSFTQVCGNVTCNSGNTIANRLAAWNGSSWSALGNGVNSGVLALAVSGDTIYAGGFFNAVCGNAACLSGNTTVNNIAVWNGSSWSALGNGVSSIVTALAVSGGTVYAGGAFTQVCGNATCNSGNTTANRVAVWNGSSWSALGNGLSGSVFALAMSGSTLYVDGWFTQICGDTICSSGDTTANNIAVWNGSSWSPLGSGANDRVLALAVSGNTLYVGGAFTSIGGVPANRIAAWNGSSWSAVGNGMGGNVDALAVSGVDVFAGGDFTQVCGNAACNSGNTMVNNIVMWNGSSWSALGNGVNSGVLALAVSGSTVYAGGGFTQVCGNATCLSGNVTVNNIAVWNGSSWSALGNGVDSIVIALAVSGSTVYAGGDFVQACGNATCNSDNTTVNYIAVWNGSSWSALGNGVNLGVEALAVSGDTLYVGGGFIKVCGNAACDSGTTTVNYIAAWNGSASAWSALGNGVSSIVTKLAVSGSTVYAGGYFNAVCGNFDCNSGNTTVNNIAAWNGSSWSALGSGMNSAVYVLGASGSDLYAGGLFTTAGGKPSFHFAHWNKSIFVYLPLIEK